MRTPLLFLNVPFDGIGADLSDSRNKISFAPERTAPSVELFQFRMFFKKLDGANALERSNNIGGRYRRFGRYKQMKVVRHYFHFNNFKTISVTD
jgi:hypothetical protein